MGTQAIQKQRGVQLWLTRKLGIRDEYAMTALSGLAEALSAVLRVLPLSDYVVPRESDGHTKTGIGLTVMSAISSMVQTLNYTGLGKEIEGLEGELKDAKLSGLGEAAVGDLFDPIDAPLNVAAAFTIGGVALSVLSRLKSLKHTIAGRVLSIVAMSFTGLLVGFQGTFIKLLHQKAPAVADSMAGGMVGQTA